MTNDDSKSEQFIREVDEEFRRAQLKSIWDRFAPLIIIACILVVAITAGYRGWIWWQARQAAANGDRFVSALQKIESGDRAAGEAELQALAAGKGAGYSALARFRLAGERANGGDKAAALKAYDDIAADSSLTAALSGLATIRAALLALDTGDLAGARQRAQPLDEAGNLWRHAAREILGTAAYQAGELQAARDFFSKIQQDAETPPDLWIRSNMMVSLIDGQLAAPGTADASSSKNAPEAGQAPAVAPAGGSPATLPVPDAAAVAGPLDTPSAVAPVTADAPAQPGIAAPVPVPAGPSPTPVAATPTPAAASPTPTAAAPTPAAASPTPAPASPTPAAASPTPGATLPIPAAQPATPVPNSPSAGTQPVIPPQ